VNQDREREWSELLIKAREGDQDSYRMLLDEILPVIRRFVRKKVSDPDAAEDLVQEVCIAVHRARHTYDPARPFTRWLLAIAHYRSVDYFRRYGVHTSERFDYSVAVDDLSSDRAEDHELREELRQAVEKLPPKQREIVQMMKYEDASVQEIATRLNASPSAVKVAAHRAYKTLRQILRAGPDGE
jgi:RNA polymerase sigma-70 factor, ECF subfamily